MVDTESVLVSHMDKFFPEAAAILNGLCGLATVALQPGSVRVLLEEGVEDSTSNKNRPVESEIHTLSDVSHTRELMRLDGPENSRRVAISVEPG